MSMPLRFILVVSLVTTKLVAQSCPNGRLSADFGYEFISCVGCLSVSRVGELRYTSFKAEPVLHKIRPDGPGANKLLDHDTLVSVGGYPVTALEAAMLLSDWQREPVDLVVRRGTIRHVSIAAAPMCIPYRPGGTQLTVPPGGKLGVAIECSGCRIERLEGGRERWVYSSPPALARVAADGPGRKAGLLRGDTLIAIDGFSILSSEAGERLGAIRPGRPMEWTIKRGARPRVVTIVPEGDVGPTPNALPRPRHSQWSVDGVSVEARGTGVSATRDEKTGALTIRGDSLTVIVRPPGVQRP
jgi:hypothetical protein